MNLCDICGTRHHAYQAHVFATNGHATNKATNESTRKAKSVVVGPKGGSDAPAGVDHGSQADNGSAGVSQQGVEEIAGGVGMGRTANRRSRVAYNAYQREYMRRVRAKASSTAD